MGLVKKTESWCFDRWISPQPLNSNWHCFSQPLHYHLCFLQEVLNALEDLNRTHTAGMHSDLGNFTMGIDWYSILCSKIIILIIYIFISKKSPAKGLNSSQSRFRKYYMLEWCVICVFSGSKAGDPPDWCGSSGATGSKAGRPNWIMAGEAENYFWCFLGLTRYHIYI